VTNARCRSRMSTAFPARAHSRPTTPAPITKASTRSVMAIPKRTTTCKPREEKPQPGPVRRCQRPFPTTRLDQLPQPSPQRYQNPCPQSGSNAPCPVPIHRAHEATCQGLAFDQMILSDTIQLHAGDEKGNSAQQQQGYAFPQIERASSQSASGTAFLSNNHVQYPPDW